MGYFPEVDSCFEHDRRHQHLPLLRHLSEGEFGDGDGAAGEHRCRRNGAAAVVAVAGCAASSLC